MMYGLLEG